MASTPIVHPFEVRKSSDGSFPDMNGMFILNSSFNSGLPLKVVNSIGFNTVEFGQSGRTINGKAIGGRTTKPAYKRNLLEEGLLSHLTSI